MLTMPPIIQSPPAPSTAAQTNTSAHQHLQQPHRGQQQQQRQPNLSHLIPPLVPRRRREGAAGSKPSSTATSTSTSTSSPHNASATNIKPEQAGTLSKSTASPFTPEHRDVPSRNVPADLPPEAPHTPAVPPLTPGLERYAAMVRRRVLDRERCGVRFVEANGAAKNDDDDDDNNNNNNDNNDSATGVKKDKAEDKHVFQRPRSHILTNADLATFEASPAHDLVVGFIFGMADSVRGKAVEPLGVMEEQCIGSWNTTEASQNEEASDRQEREEDRVIGLATTRTVRKILDAMDDILDDTPREEDVDADGNVKTSRFGNRAFRTYVDKVERRMGEWHEWLGLDDRNVAKDEADDQADSKENGTMTKDKKNKCTATEEISAYLLASLGSPARLDYGSGHEMNFVLWLLCLHRVGLLPAPSLYSSSSSLPSSPTTPTTLPLITLHLFPRYIALARRLQATYYLEPAGSHGVWGLDDHQFLPFLFGAAQLVGHAVVRPRSVHSALTLEENADRYLYLDQIRHVNGVKTVKGLRWHSPMLDDISAAKSWAKVEMGMRRMLLREVLGKRAVMQHFLGGSLVGWEWRRDGERGMVSEGGRALNGDLTGAVVSMASVEKGSNGGVCHHEEHGHQHSQAGDDDHEHTQGWGDCCGIRVPSSAGALQEMRKRMGEQGLRPIPFD